MTTGGDHADMQLEGHRKYAAELVGLQTAGGNQTLAFENRPGYPESVLPMGIAGVNLDPVLLCQIVKINDVMVGSVVNRKPRQFSNVKVFGADNWYNPAQGSMRNLVIKPNLKGNIF